MVATTTALQMALCACDPGGGGDVEEEPSAGNCAGRHQDASPKVPDATKKPSKSAGLEAGAGQLVSTATIVVEHFALKASAVAKSYDKLCMRAPPKSREIVNGLINIGMVVVVAGGYSDVTEVACMAVCNTKPFADLASSSMLGNDS